LTSPMIGGGPVYLGGTSCVAFALELGTIGLNG
jgi:hypothetical protein